MGESKSKAVYTQTEKRLNRLLTGEDAVIRGKLANLRRSAGKQPGEDPRAWGILFSDLPEDMLAPYGEPSREEWAIHTALTLFAIHQQGNDPLKRSMNQQGASLGDAASRLVAVEGGDEDARERVARRFHQAVLAPDMAAMAYYLRSFIQLLRAADISLDYPKLARDLYLYQLPDGAASVRLQWGQDFYRSDKNEDANINDEVNENGKDE